MPQNDDDFDDGTPSPKPKGGNDAAQQKPASKFLQRYVRDAEKLGIPQDEIDACTTNSELRELVEYETRKAEQSRARLGRSGDRTQQQQQAVSPPPPPPKEPDWTLSEEAERDVAAPIKGELKRLGKELVKATKRGDEDRIEAIEKKIDAIAQRLERTEAANSPIVRAINRTLAKYPALFGDTPDDRESNPRSVFARNYKFLDEEMMRRREAGELTENVERDLHAAIADLFPGAKPAGKEATPGSQPARRTRADAWADAGTPPASHRNGADTTGKPGGKKAAAAKVREKLREAGYDAGDDYDDSDDDSDDI